MNLSVEDGVAAGEKSAVLYVHLIVRGAGARGGERVADLWVTRVRVCEYDIKRKSAIIISAIIINI